MPKTPTTPFIDLQKVQQMEPDIAAIRQTVEQHLAAVRETVEQLAPAGAAVVEGADTILANPTIKLKIAEALGLMHRGIDLIR